MLLNLQLRLIRLTGISTQKMIPNPTLPNFAIHPDINCIDIFKLVEVAAVSVNISNLFLLFLQWLSRWSFDLCLFFFNLLPFPY